MSDNYLLHKRILVVDDEQALLDMICSILQAYGFQNTTTAEKCQGSIDGGRKVSAGTGDTGCDAS